MAKQQPKKSSTPVAKSSAAPATPKTQPPSSDRVAARAYEIWQESGCPHGQDVEHWYRAERELRAPVAR